MIKYYYYRRPEQVTLHPSKHCTSLYLVRTLLSNFDDSSKGPRITDFLKEFRRIGLAT